MDYVKTAANPHFSSENFNYINIYVGYPVAQKRILVVKNLPASARDMGLIPGLGRSPAGGNGNPLQYSCLENSQAQRSPP